MKYVLLAVMLMAGCAGTLPDPNSPNRKPDIQQVVTQIHTGAIVAGKIADLFCDFYSADSPICSSLKNSWTMVLLALDEVDKLFDTFTKTGLGEGKVYEAVEKVNVCLGAMRDNAAQLRSLAEHAARTAKPSVLLGRPARQPSLAATGTPAAVFYSQRQLEQALEAGAE